VIKRPACLVIHSFIHSRYFYSASSSPLLLRGTPDYIIDTVSELTRRRQMWMKDLSKVPMRQLELDLNLRPSGRKTPNILFVCYVDTSAEVYLPTVI